MEDARWRRREEEPGDRDRAAVEAKSSRDQEGTLTIYIAYGECMLRQNISQTLPDPYVHSGMFSELQPKTSLNLCHAWTGIFCKQAQAALRHGKYSGRLRRVATKHALFVLMVKGYFIPEFVV
uniref:Uncharacterized protein n=1 Tax=Oryza rufipogon TaxID=4529 RepID=A0A0E0P5K9_ORYRU